MSYSKEQIRGLLKSMSWAILRIRDLGYKGENQGLSTEESKLFASLADAVHNIPESILSENQDIELLLDVLINFGEANENEIDLFSIYERGLKGEQC